MYHLLVMSTAAASTMCAAMTSVLSSIVIPSRYICLVLRQLIFSVANCDYIHNYMYEKYMLLLMR